MKEIVCTKSLRVNKFIQNKKCKKWTVNLKLVVNLAFIALSIVSHINIWEDKIKHLDYLTVHIIK